MKAHMYGMTVDQRWVPMIVGDQGFGLGGVSGASSASPLANGWSYAAASGGITDISDVAIKAAAGPGKYNYLSQIDLVNAAAAVATEVVVKDGSTVIYRTFLPANAEGTAPIPAQVTFSPPLVGSNNMALNVACVTTSAQVYVNARGFVGGAPNQVELNTNTPTEVYSRNGDLLSDRAGATIFLRSN